jgi:C4-dicarboxylate-specific signal transduction histidine kinase
MHTMTSTIRRNVTILIALLLITISVPASEPRGRSILILSPAEPLRPSISAFVSGLQSGLDRALPGTNILVVEQVGSWEDTAASPGVRKWFDEKYRDHKFDAIIGIGSADLDIAQRLRDERWPDAKVFYALFPQGVALVPRPRNTAGIVADYVPSRAVTTTIQLLPSTKHLFAIGGGSPGDRLYDRWLFGEIHAAYPTLPITDLTGLPLKEMIARTSKLPPDSALLMMLTIADVDGRPINVPQLVRSMSSVTNAPIFDFLDLSFGDGAVGGALLSWDRFGQELAPQVAKVFDGSDPNDLPDLVLHPVLRFDARQLARWSIPESRLPAGSTVEFKAPTLWSEHKRLIVATLLVVALQTMLIDLLLLQRRRLLLSKEARTKSEEALHSQEALNHAVLRSLPGYVCILDRSGTIVQVNELWSAAGSDIASGFLASTKIGDNYISSWESCCRNAGIMSGSLQQHIKAILAGEDSVAVLEWQYSGPDAEAHWLEIRCNRLQWSSGGAVVDLVEITERKKAEMKAQRNLQTLSQFHRVAALGELAGALAHELNQPLASILINAETLAELLSLEALKNREAYDIVQEIISDDERAGQIIHKMRRLLQDRDTNVVALSLTEVAASVVKLLTNEAMLRRVTVRCELANDLPRVLGDTVQLQQVVLNLMLNAMDAVRDLPEDRRNVSVATYQGIDESVIVEVRDTGPGISPENLPLLFDHFFTTKREGLGLGLSISKSIVEALDGRIDADSNSVGARFRVAIPPVKVLSTEEVPV